MGNILQDLRFSIRFLAKKPGFTIGLMLALALAIGVNSAMFSVINTILLRPLPYRDAHRIQMIWEANLQKGLDQFKVSHPNLADWRYQSSSFDQIAAYKTPQAYTLTDRSQPERLLGVPVSANLFQVLGVSTSSGRTFADGEDQPGQSNIVIFSHSLWERLFNADSGIIGRPITLDGKGYTVVGVMPSGFEFPPDSKNIDMWVPLTIGTANTERASRQLQVIGRLKDGVSEQQAKSELVTISRRLAAQYPEANMGWEAKMASLKDHLVRDVKPALYVLMGAVVFVLLIACANVANLLLVRAVHRQKEMALRVALGASRLRLIRQLLTESLLLGVLSGALGVALAYWTLKVLVALSPGNIPRLKDANIDGWVLGFTLVVSVLTSIGFGLAPALIGSKQSLSEVLKESGGRASSGSHSSRSRRLLMVSEIAIALVLLIGAGLMVRSFARLQQIAPGFNPEGVLTMRISLPNAKYSEQRQWANGFQQILQRVEALPGVQSAGAVTTLPLSADNLVFDVSAQDQVSVESDVKLTASFNGVSPDYFRAMGIPLIKGRHFADSDIEGSPRVMIISETLAKRLWGQQEPIGKSIIIGFGEPVTREIIGVVGDVKHTTLDAEGQAQMYAPYLQIPLPFMAIVVRTSSDSGSLIGAIGSQVADVDKELPVFRLRPMDQLLSDSVGKPRFHTLLLGIFAGLALVLAGLGIYSVMSYSVNERIHEIGIRMALGAQPKDIFKMIVGHGMILTLFGVAIGLAAALILTPVMASLLYGVGRTDPIIFVAVSVLLAGIAFLACCIPARRASSVDPMVALRYE